MMQDFYLAHPFDSRFRLKVWAEGVAKKYHVSIMNPFYDSGERVDIIEIDAGRQERYDRDDAKIVEGDLICIKDTKATIANVTGELSYGTIMEIAYSYLFGHPVYIIVTNGHEKHPWLTYHATKVFTSYEDFDKWLSTSEYVK
jgi:nucleoside 2-deoxyribosyltransferase